MTQSSTPASFQHRYRYLVLGAFVVLVVGISTLIGVQSLPGPWYDALSKPPFNPPNWVFGPVWFVLYCLIAVAGWRIFMRAPASATMALWGMQMGVNWIWSPAFFLAQAPWLALGVIVVLLGLVIGFIVSAHRRDRLAAWLFVPYAAWVGFATLLNGAIAVLN